MMHLAQHGSSQGGMPNLCMFKKPAHLRYLCSNMVVRELQRLCLKLRGGARHLGRRHMGELPVDAQMLLAADMLDM